MKWREWRFSHPCQSKNIADRAAIVEGRREPTEEVAVKSFEMSVRGANGKNELQVWSGLLMRWIWSTGRREFPFNLQRRRITGPASLESYTLPTRHSAIRIEIENEENFFFLIS